MIADQMAADKRGKVPARPETIKKFSSQKASIKIICDEASFKFDARYTIVISVVQRARCVRRGVQRI